MYDDDGVGGYRFVPVLVGFNDVGCAQGAKRARNVFQFLQPGRKGCDLESVITSATAESLSIEPLKCRYSRLKVYVHMYRYLCFDFATRPDLRPNFSRCSALRRCSRKRHKQAGKGAKTCTRIRRSNGLSETTNPSDNIIEAALTNFES
ncbi:hypothetical protein CEK26_009944 [Fusarium fujikuroi]|uniref:Uncharacterized protein n=1 Tax=Fusarium fujikuroi TaxID=5127 RepID=A0A5Q3G0E2_FUSFU|nr:hypothetical protein CEK25_009962 [Fusarium fujikuroi]QGI96875.1 hypothetical protein CEK26_009944 [Fusarium fujikuroi]VTT59600.1 unnamed protein product [Fusarium fujikuroi]VTT75936.1 unnamed protein product [Fusarium fujikuroi]VZI05937.1 unnamed protein product [Fusarium fujikuroi]